MEYGEIIQNIILSCDIFVYHILINFILTKLYLNHNIFKLNII